MSGFTSERRTPWEPGARGIDEVVAQWQERGLGKNVCIDVTMPARDEVASPLTEVLPEAMRRALAARGVEKLYAHQWQSLELARAGQSFVVATPTASGKSFCYNLPLLEALASDSEARALYVFPTKALSRDQEFGVRALMRDAGLQHGAITFDGDTPGDARRNARERGGVILTNPDMLHSGILPHHANWSRVFSNLKLVVFDELHSYRGVFGSHLANVIRRLRRIAHFHGSDPLFVGASATIGNPAEHASRMFGTDVALVDQSGAPTGPRRVVVYNPPVVNAELGVRESYLKTSVKLAADLVTGGVPTLVFGQSRNGVEVMLKYLRDRLSKTPGFRSEMVQAYRGGYLPNERRAIEQQLRDGAIRCVVATSALELGIDIGSLDAVICAGYPGSLAATKQRFGRAGRREATSIGVLVTSSNPLDQFLAQNANALVDAPIEEARIDPDNVEILVQHLKCASFELPFEEGDSFGELPALRLQDALNYLADNGLLHLAPNSAGVPTYHWSADAYPASQVSLRSVSWDNFVIVDLATNKTIAEMDYVSTHTMLHEQAIYQHDADQYQVERLDFENHKAYVREVKPDYYTTAMTHTKVTVTDEEKAEQLALGTEDTKLVLRLGEVSVIEKVVGYKKIKFHTHENVGYGDVHLPELQKHTAALWLTFPERLVDAVIADLGMSRAQVVDCFSGLMNAMHLVASVALMVDPRDLGHVMGDAPDPSGPARSGGAGFDPTIFVFDSAPGGIGLASRLFDEREALLRRTRNVLDGCACSTGCPACIGPSASPELELSGSRRSALLRVLDYIQLPAAH